MRERIFHRAAYHSVLDWLRCGWMVAIPNGPTHDDRYGVMVEWLCDCKMVRPL